ncbi:MAG: rod shape-determining protein MreD [Ammonifex sp.]|nr:MAG: rod shape-determining protein MreD [Ammonifex sp.]
MRTVTLFCLVGLALLLEHTVLNFVRVAGVKPDLVLLIVVFNGILKGSREGAFWGFIAGLLEDFACGQYLGLHALSKLAAGYVAGLGDYVYKESSVVAAAMVWGASLISGGLMYLLLLTLGITVGPADAFSRVVLPVAVYNGLLCPLFYHWFRRATVYGVLREERY